MLAVSMWNRWTTYVLVGLYSACLVYSEKNPPGLLCVNDYINNVSCTWNSSQVDRDDCLVMGVKKTWRIKGFKRESYLMNRSCRLNPLGSTTRGCSFVFESKSFSYTEVLPRIEVKCNGTLVENLTNYKPSYNIKLHPPGTPNVSSSANETLICWSPGSPRSDYFETFEFQVQIRHDHQKWQEASNQSTQKLRFLNQGRRAGHYQVRVRVKPPLSYPDTLWSDWSSVTSWVMEPDTTQNQVFFTAKTAALGGMFIFFITLLIIITRSRRQIFKSKPVPDPSKYFCGVHSVHNGNLERWLNPQSAPGSFFISQPSDTISPVEVFDTTDVAPPSPASTNSFSPTPSASSTTTTISSLLHCHPSGLSSGQTDGSSHPGPSSSLFFYVSSFSSTPCSCFSNLGYYTDDDPPDAADPCHTYPLLRDPPIRASSKLLLSRHPPALSCKRLQLLDARLLVEPQSPDSGFCVGTEDPEDEEMVRGWEEEEEEEQGGKSLCERGRSLVLILSTCPHSSGTVLPSNTPPASHSGTQPLINHIIDHIDDYEEDEGEPRSTSCVSVPRRSYGAWPTAGGGVGRTSSMPEEACYSGYLTLKELPTTFSNKSI